MVLTCAVVDVMIDRGRVNLVRFGEELSAQQRVARARVSLAYHGLKLRLLEVKL